MCIAIMKPKEKTITDDILERCFLKNSDGAGFSYIKTNNAGTKSLEIFKTLFFKKFLKEYRKIEAIYTDSPFLIHFRIKTHGPINIDNCHPFQIDDDHVFIHNGIISAAPADVAGKKSDTRMFNQTILRQLPVGWIGNPAIKLMIEDYIGFSKLAVLGLDGHTELFNESKGEWSEGVWYSNEGYKAPKVWNREKQTSYLSDDYCSNYAYVGGRRMDGAYHGDLQWNAVGSIRRMEKFDFYTDKWICRKKFDELYPDGLMPKAASKAKDGEVIFLPNKTDSDRDSGIELKDLLENIYDIEVDALHEIAKEMDVPSSTMTFTLHLEDVHGCSEELEFERCEYCGKPDYLPYIKDLTLEDTPFRVCEGCDHNLSICHMN